MLQQTLCFKVLNISYMYTHSYEFKKNHAQNKPFFSRTYYQFFKTPEK